MRKRIKKNAFTLVELLAVIVILAIILVIAVPKVMSIIGDAKKGTLESTAKMIASSAEKAKVQNTVLGNTESITCESVTKLNNVDYESCSISFEGNTAKVTIKGKGKFAGLNVCDGTKMGAEANDEECLPPFEKDDWATIVSKVKSGNHPYQVGNSKSIEMDINGNGEVEEYTIRVANTAPCEGLSVTSKTACGFVLEFADIITTHNMNPAGEYNGKQYNYGHNLGGWPASAMRTYVNSTIYNALPDKLRNGIINTYVVLSHGSNPTMGNIQNENAGVLEGSNYWSNDKLYLLSPQEVYGTSFAEDYDSSNGTSRQLDYYATYEGTNYIGVSTTNYEGAEKSKGETFHLWWLRSAYYFPGYDFYVVYNGSAGIHDSPHYKNGVSPAFRLAD